jgi:hypothetical protein
MSNEKTRPRPPSVPEWLWERVLDTQTAVDRWATRSFNRKLRRYLRHQARPSSSRNRSPSG